MVHLKNVSFKYNKSFESAALSNINLEIKKGEVVVLCGKSGCGKTSIIRLINGLIPHFYEGELEGEIWVNGKEIPKTPLSLTADKTGSVFQNPRSQFFNVDTTSELAFGCENQGMEQVRIQERVKEAEEVLKLTPLMNRDIFELSGGEKQQIACGSVYAAHPDVVVLDEPSSNLDVAAILRLRDIIAKLKDQGKTIIISEHRLYYLTELADRFVYLADGHMIKEYTGKEFQQLSPDDLKKKGLRCTDLRTIQKESRYTGTAHKKEEHPAVSVSKLSCRYKQMTAVKIEELNIPKGSVVALIGDNGAGKSTLSESLCGVLPCTGEIRFNGELLNAKQRTQKSFMVMQDVNHQLFKESVREEIAMNASGDMAEKVPKLLKKMDLEGLEERHPASLSGGQKQRVAVCAALCADKEIVFYDEPTSGLDYDGMTRLCNLITDSKAQVLTSIVITHDLELVMGCCTHVLELQDGKVSTFYELDEQGAARVKEFFIKKEGTRMRENKKPASRPEGLGRLVQLAMTRKSLMIPSMVLSILASVASFIPYLCIYWIVERITQVYPDFDAASQTAIVKYGALAFGGVILNVLFYYIALFLSHLAAFGTSYALKINFTSYLAKLPLGFHLNYGSGRLRKITDNNIGRVEDFIAHQFPDLIAAIAAPVVMIIILFAVDWRYGIVSLIGVVISYMVQMAGFGGSSAQEMMTKYQSEQENMNNASVEYVRGITVVKAFHQTVYSFRRLYDSIRNYTDFAVTYNLKFETGNSLYTALVNNIYLFLIPVIILTGIHMPAGGYGEFASAAMFYLLFVPAISSVMTKVMYSASSCMQVSSCVERLDEVMDMPPLPEPSEPKMCAGGEVRFSNVSFRYDEREHTKALDDVTFTAPAGKITAVVGPSGGGKSTIAHLIPRFYDVTDGNITIGGVDIRDMKTEELTGLVSFVFQDVFLFKQSILENIRMGCPGASHEAVLAAAKAARCDSFISALPQGYDTVYGKGGVYLSGGEKQRIAIARAIVRNAPILVLDEATAFSDPENEHLIQQALTVLMKDKTVIMIAHRLSTVTGADQILVMDEGKIVERGDHDTLLKTDGRYRQLWEKYTRALSWKIEKEAAEHA